MLLGLLCILVLWLLTENVLYGGLSPLFLIDVLQ
jgi:hypothetical protein